MMQHSTDKEILFPHAKINLGLFVTRRRDDGYHILQTLFYPIDWRDALEIRQQGATLPDTPFLTTADGRIRWFQTGIQVNCDPELNLCVKAYRLLQERFPGLPPVDMHLQKEVPFGAGLGGGSSDGAHALLMLRHMFQLDVTDAELEAMAAHMGADCAFFCRCGSLYNTAGNDGRMVAQYCEGIGHELQPHPLTLQGYHIVVVKPPFGVSTREAYSNVHPERPATDLCELLKLPLAEWKESVRNDFEASVFPLHPELQQAKDTLYRHGAIYASMSGSGSALFGIFAADQPDCQQWFADGYMARCHAALV